MPDETQPTEKEQATKAYHDAKTPAEKAEVVKKYPILAQLFAAVNHAVGIALLFFGLSAFAGSSILVGSMATINNTTSNSVSVAAGTLTLPGGYFLIQNGGLTATNALVVNAQFSTDNTNFTTVATYYPTATNATTDKFFVSSAGLQTVYFRLSVVTTNSVQVGATFQQ